MIVENLLKVVNDIQFRIEQENGRLVAIKSFRELLSDIDFTSEVVPVEDETRLTRLLVSLKGKPLTKDEMDLINEITKN